MKVPTTLAAVIALLATSASCHAQPLISSRQAGGVNICAAVQGTSNGCVESAAVAEPLFFTCSNSVQTLFTCDGGCRQLNAANLPTCDNGKLFHGSVV